MGAKTCMLAYANGNPAAILRTRPTLDRAATLALAKTLFPADRLVELEDGSLEVTYPPNDELIIGCFPGLAIIAATEFGIDKPSELGRHFLAASPYAQVTLHAMHSVVDWFAFAVWRDGELTRALSLSPDSGILEDVGEKLAFELPYWAGSERGGDEEDSDLPFHPLELAEAALGACFGYRLEGEIDPTDLEPETITLMRFKRPPKAWWRFW